MSVSNLLDSESPAVFDTELSVDDTLVVHAPALGVGDTVDSVAETEAPCVRVETEPLAADETAVAGEDHSEPAARVVVEDLWTAYAEADSAAWDALRRRVAGPDATVAVFVRPHALDWLVREDGPCGAAFLDAFDRIVHLRYDPDDTLRGGAIDQAIHRARAFETGDAAEDAAGDGAAEDAVEDAADDDATDDDIEALLDAHVYRHDYRYGPLVEAAEYGPTLTPGIVRHRPSSAVDTGGLFDTLRAAGSELGASGTLREFFGNVESAVSELLSSGGVAVAAGAVNPALGAGAALALWLWLRDGGDGVPAVVEQVRDTDLPPTACAELDAKLGEPPGAVAIAQRLSEPSLLADLVDIAREGGRLDGVEATQADHEAVLAEYGAELDALRDRLAALEARLDRVEADVEALQDAAPAKPGVDRLTVTDFETGRIDDYCWRRSFTLGEAWAGYPLERERPPAGDTDERQDLTEQLLDTLADGGGAALLGAPGSGKTTATRTAMAEWVRRHDGGTVFYRRKGVQTPVDYERLREEIETARANGPVLVAVEDAARRGSSRVFETVADFEAAEDVSFLVNSREEEWTDTGDGLTEIRDGRSARANDVEATRTEYLEPVYVPPLDAREVERFVENYRAVTGSDGDAVDGAALLSQIRSQTGISPMLLLAYHVPVWGDEIGEHTDDKPALVENVCEVFDAVHGEASDAEIEAATSHERALLERVALAVNVLNAAEVSVREEFLLALGAEGDEYETVQAVTGRLQGPLLFEEDDRTYATHHPLWSRLYLSEHLERHEKTAAIGAFETVLDALFRLIDDEERRDAIRTVFRTDTELLRGIEKYPAAFGHELVTDLFGIGVDRPELQPLYGTTEYSQIELPAVCGARTEVETAFSRSRMFNRRGESDRELAAVETAGELAEDAGIDDGGVLWKYYLGLGHHAEQQGELDEARDYYERAREVAPESDGGENEAVIHGSLGNIDLQQGAYREAENHYQKTREIYEDIEDRTGEAASLNSLGLVAESLGKYELARERHKESLAIKREIGDRGGEANSLGNLGSVARNLGEYERAQERNQESLAIEREIGDRGGEAASFNSLGLVAQSLSEYERARERHQKSLDIFREIGNRGGEANSLGNLGLVARHLGEHERARERHKESMAIKREIGDRGGEANSLNSLGLVAQSLGKYEFARERHKESLEICREIGDRGGEANSLGNLGLVARHLGEYERAWERHQESLEICREIGDRGGEANSLGNLGSVARHLGEYERAWERHQESLAIKREIGVRGGEANSLNSLGLVAQSLGKYEFARERHEESLAIKREIGDRGGEANSLTNLGTVEHEQKNYRAAIENYSDAAEVFRDIGAVRRALKALLNLSRAATEIGEAETALDACREALDLIEQSDLDGLDDRAREFRRRAARLNDRQ